MASLAQHLPPEILNLIFEALCEEPAKPPDWESSFSPDIGQQRKQVYTSYALVCRAWYEPAQKQLYAFVEVFDGHSLPLLHASLAGPSGSLLSTFLQHLDIDIRAAGPQEMQQLLETLNYCPPLRSIVCSSESWALLAGLGPGSRPWMALHLNTLALFNDGVDFPMPLPLDPISPLFDCSRLRNLHLYHWDLTFPAASDILPNLNTLTLTKCVLRFAPGAPKSFFPSMPRLKILVVADCSTDVRVHVAPSGLALSKQHMQDCYRCLFLDVGQTLTQLELNHQTAIELRDENFELLPNLEHLTLVVASAYPRAGAPTTPVQTLSPLPSSLRTIHITWRHSAAQAVRYMRALQSPAFLPNLRSLPILARNQRIFEDASADEFFEQQARAKTAMLQRGLVKGEADFHLHRYRKTIWQEDAAGRR